MEPSRINSDVTYYGGAGPTNRVALPETDQATPDYAPPLLDTVGEQLRTNKLPILAGAVLGNAAGIGWALRSGRGWSGRAGLAALGSVVGAALTIAGGTALDRVRGTGTSHTQSVAADTGAKVASTEVSTQEQLKVMSFNVHGGMGAAGKFQTSDEDLDRIAEEIRRADPDVVLLQELDRSSFRSTYKDVMGELAERLDPDGAAYTPRGTLVSGRQEGTGVMTFHGTKVADARGIVAADPLGSGVGRRIGLGFSMVRDLVRGTVLGVDEEQIKRDNDTSGPTYYPRVTTDAMLVTPKGNHVRVMAGHYNGPDERVDYQPHQVGPVARMVGEWKGPTIWGADWNVASDTQEGRLERELTGEAGMQDAFLGSDPGLGAGDWRRNSGGASLDRDLDRIYHSSHFTVNSVDVVHEPDPKTMASDHRPVVAELTLQPDAQR